MVISHPPTEKEEEHEESKKEEGEEEKDKTKDEEETTAKNGDSATDSSQTKSELYTLTAKPQKHNTGSYGWSASVPKGKIKVEIDGEVVELPVTINLNITVQGSSKK